MGRNILITAVQEQIGSDYFKNENKTHFIVVLSDLKLCFKAVHQLSPNWCLPDAWNTISHHPQPTVLCDGQNSHLRWRHLESTNLVMADYRSHKHSQGPSFSILVSISYFDQQFMAFHRSTDDLLYVYIHTHTKKNPILQTPGKNIRIICAVYYSLVSSFNIWQTLLWCHTRRYSLLQLKFQKKISAAKGLSTVHLIEYEVSLVHLFCTSVLEVLFILSLVMHPTYSSFISYEIILTIATIILPYFYSSKNMV